MKNWFRDLWINFLFLYSGSKSRAPSVFEKEIALTAEKLSENGYEIFIDTAHEKWVFRQYTKDSCMIKYTYDFISKTQDASSIYIVTRIEREANSTAAKEVFDQSIKDYAKGLEKRKNRFILKGNLKSWSDNAFASFIIDETEDFVHGCVLVFQKNNLVYSIITSGIFFEDKEEINGMLFPLLEGAEKWALQGNK